MRDSKQWGPPKSLRVTFGTLRRFFFETTDLTPQIQPSQAYLDIFSELPEHMLNSIRKQLRYVPGPRIKWPGGKAHLSISLVLQGQWAHVGRMSLWLLALSLFIPPTLVKHLLICRVFILTFPFLSWCLLYQIYTFSTTQWPKSSFTSSKKPALTNSSQHGFTLFSEHQASGRLFVELSRCSTHHSQIFIQLT